MFQAPAYVGILGPVNREQQDWLLAMAVIIATVLAVATCIFTIAILLITNVLLMREQSSKIKSHRTYVLRGTPHGSFLGTPFILKTKNTNMEMEGLSLYLGGPWGPVHARQVYTTEIYFCLYLKMLVN